MLNYVLLFCLSIGSVIAYSQRFAAIGDFGTNTEGEAEVANIVNSWNPEFIITMGDNNYPSGAAETIDLNIGQYYSEYIFPYTGNYGSGADENRFFPSLGNHDYFTEEAAPYFDYFTLPGNERYYDFVRGDVHFFSLNVGAEEDIDGNLFPHEPDGNTVDSEQALWLQEKLSTSEAKWQVVYFHDPPYSSGFHGSTLGIRWPFAEWGVDAVLSGHDHHYERSLVDCIPYFVNGVGGRTLHNTYTRTFETLNSHRGDFGAMLIEVDSEKMVFEFWTASGIMEDSFTIYAAGNDERAYQCGELISLEDNQRTSLHYLDLNTDGLKDILYLLDGGLKYVKNLGNDAFSEPVDLIAGVSGFELIGMGDANDDGYEDLFWREIFSCEVFLSLNNGNGTFLENELLFTSSCEPITKFAFQDVNNDDLLDIMLSTAPGGMFWAENLGNGSFDSETNDISLSPNYLFDGSPIFSDIDEDGVSDVLVIANNVLTNSYDLVHYINSGSGIFTEVVLRQLNSGEQWLTLANLDGDDEVDLLFMESSDIHWMEFQSEEFLDQDIIALDLPGPHIVIDIDSDGLDDFVSAVPRPEMLLEVDVQWSRNEEANVFSDSKLLVESSYFFNHTNASFEDLDNDGDMEFIFQALADSKFGLFHYSNHSFETVFHGGPADLDNDGSVNIGDLTVFLTSFGTECSLDSGPCLGDLNKDGFVNIRDLIKFLSLYGTVYCQ